MSLDDLDRQLLNSIQEGFPLVERPYAVLGDKLGLPEDQVIARLARLKAAGIVREISAIFDSARLGYRSLLVALAIPPERLHAVGQMVSAEPGVSHCYAREHRYNLWFTLTAPPGEDPSAQAHAIGRQAGGAPILVLPSLRRFKIGVRFDVRDGAPHGCALAASSPQRRQRTLAPASGDRPRAGSGQLGATPRAPSEAPLPDREVVRALQADLPLEPRPFRRAAARLGLTEGQLLAEAARLQACGVVRRYAAVLRHRKVGIHGNGMSCWSVETERVAEVGMAMAQWPSVTHCYERPTCEDWPYRLFGMLHWPTQEECLRDAAALAAHVGVQSYVVLFSTHEFKKERVRYFEAS